MNAMQRRLTALERAAAPERKPVLLLTCSAWEPQSYRGGADFVVHRREAEGLDEFNARAGREARVRGVVCLTALEREPIDPAASGN